jgi:hypothetical protein
LVCGIIFSIALVVLLPSWAKSGEQEAVRKTVELYFQGQATGDGNYFRKAFHPEAKLFWVRDGKFTQRTSEEFAAGASGKPATDEAQRKRTIESIDVTGNAASVKVALDYPSVKYTDYLSLLKIEGEWKIVNKIFFAEPKQKQ